jgi:TPR repeat protein
LSKIDIDSDYKVRCKAVAEKEEIDFEILFLTLVETLKNFPLFEDPSGINDAVARRVIAKYSNGIIFTVPIDGSPFLTNLKIKTSNIDPQIEFEKWKSNIANSKDWEWSWSSFGWRINKYDNETIIKILQELKSIYGEPRIVLPWMSFVEQYLDDPEYFDENFVEDDENLQAGAELIASFEDLESDLIEIWEGNEDLSENCAYNRFDKMLQKLKDEHNWIVLYECCGPCARSSIRKIQESNPEKLNSSTFVVWEQSASDSFFADGDLKVTHYLGQNINEITELELAASKFGFKVEQDLNNKDENNKSVSITDSKDPSKIIKLLDENKKDRNSDKFNEIISAAIQEIENSNLKKAEELLVDAHERSRNASDIDSSALMIIEKILMPQSRLIETEMWIRSIVNTSKRQELRNKLKEIGPLVPIKRVTEISDWKHSNISEAIQKSSNQQYFYNRFVKYLSAQEPETLNRDTMSTWPGPGFYGFLSGFFEGNETIFQMGCERETIALAIFDFFNFVMEDPLGSEERNPDIHDAPYENYSEEQILKLCKKNDPWALKQYGLSLYKRGESDSAIKIWTKAATLGNHTSMRNLGLTAFKNGNSKEAISYLQNAIEAGSSTSHHLLATIYEQTNPELVEKTLLEGMKLLDVAAINHLGTLKQREKKWDEAIYYFRKAAEYGDFVAMANLANVLFIKEPDQSLIWLIRAEDKNPLESQKIISYLRKEFQRRMARDSETTVRCGNEDCDNKSARADAICENPIWSSEDGEWRECDYVNYVASKSVYSLRLKFLLPSVSDEVLEQLQEDQEIYIDLNGLNSINDSDAFFQHNYSAEFGEFVNSYLSSLLMSWGLTFGIPSELIPDPNQSEGPKFDSLVITLEEDEIQVALEIQMYLQSHQDDMLHWYPNHLKNTLMDDEDFVWVHEGNQITLNNVEVKYP